MTGADVAVAGVIGAVLARPRRLRFCMITGKGAPAKGGTGGKGTKFRVQGAR